jgi:chromate transporter
MASEPDNPRPPSPRGLRDALAVGLKLGLLGFGGPAAHAAMLQDEVCERRRWMNRESFMDLLGAVNLIPGPNSSEMVMEIGRRRAGVAGAVVAGLAFLVPAMLMTGVLAWAYVRFGYLPAATGFLAGIKPAMLVVILAAIGKLARPAIKDWRLAFVAAVVLVVGYARGQEILVLALGTAAGTIWRLRVDATDEAIRRSRGGPKDPNGAGGMIGLASGGATLTAAGGALGIAGAGAVLGKLFLFFLVVGSLLYGSGYVLIAFLEGTLVRNWHWLTRQELLDAVAAGQLTPGPLLTTATFVGYLVGAHQGPGYAIPAALLATIGIFLPSFVLVALLGRYLPRLRQVHWTSRFLDAVSASALGLMAAVLLRLGQATLFPPGAGGLDGRAAIVTAAAAAAVFWLRLNLVWIVLGGAVLGFGLAQL